jgi:hypothetical protein
MSNLTYRKHFINNIGKGIHMAVCSARYILHGIIPSLFDSPQTNQSEKINTILLENDSDEEEMIEFESPPSPLPL